MLFISSLSLPAAAQEAPSGVPILSTFSSWRMYHVFKAPEIAFDSGVKPIAFGHYWLDRETPPPRADWALPDFDDSGWLRGPALIGSKTPFVARTCFRGKFRVANPARVKKLTLTVSYHGGVVVYVNGKEVRRGHLAARSVGSFGRPDDAARAKSRLAEAYPVEAFVTRDGILLAKERQFVMVGGRMVRAGRPDADARKRMALRARTLADVEISPRLLRKGVNVLAVEILRAPYHKVVDEKKSEKRTQVLYDLHWNTCEILGLSLTAGGGKEIEPGATRPPGRQVWNGSTLRTDFHLDFGDPCEPLRPIALTGVRNGTFSGKVLVGDTSPIRKLKATLGALKGARGTMHASALRVRYGVPLGAEYGICEYMYGFGSGAVRWPGKAGALSALFEAPPEEYPVRRAGGKPAPGMGAPVFGAVAPVWVTVKVPPTAKPGVYEGILTIESEGAKPTRVPVRLEVLDWALPDPYEYKTWIELMQSPDTLSLEYGVKPWSDKHFDLIARSMRFLREVGSGVVYVPLICCTNYGNEESMVRWVDKGANQYEFDFSVMDRYLDVAEENMGKPKVVCFIVWDIFLLPRGDSHRDARRIDGIKDRMTEPAVTLLDPATKKPSRLSFSNYYTDPASKVSWRKLFTGLRSRMKKRQLEEAMMVGWFSDSKPSKEEIVFFSEVSGNLPWVSHSHWTTSNKHYFGKILGSGFRTGYMTTVYETVFPGDPAKGRTYGWKNPVLHAQNIRIPSGLDLLPHTTWRSLGEINIAGGQRGFGRIGGDYWSAVRDNRGRRRGRAYQRYPWSQWGNLDLRSSLLAPGPEGAVATSRFEVLREGVQECEARIFLEQALTEKGLRRKLGGDLARRCQEALDERIFLIRFGVSNLEMSCYAYYVPWNWNWQTGEAGHAWFQSSGWRERSAKLYKLAGEVAKKVGRR